MADHSKPVLTSLYADFLSELDSRIEDLAVGLDPARTTATGQPTYSNRWNSAAGKWEQWGGTAWADMASVYNININGTVNSSTVPTGVTLTSTSDKLSAFSATTSAELAGVVSDKTGSGYLVFSNSPNISSPTLTLQPNTVSPTEEGDIRWDTVNDRIVVGDSTGQKYFIPTVTFNTDATVSTTGVVTVQNNVITDAKIRQGTALSLIGRSSNSLGNVADITATAASGLVLRESGSTIGFGTIDTSAYANSTSSTTGVTYAKMQYVSATDKILGRSTAGSGVVEEITCTSFGRALLDDTSVVAQRTTLGLQYFATYNGDVNNYVEVIRGGTGANDRAGACTNILPTGASNGQVLVATSPSTFAWQAIGTVAGVNYGTYLTSGRIPFTATAGQTYFPGLNIFESAKNQVRPYVNGIRLYTADFTEGIKSWTSSQVSRSGLVVTLYVTGHNFLVGDKVYWTSTSNPTCSVAGAEITAISAGVYIQFSCATSGTITLVADVGTGPAKSYSITTSVACSLNDSVMVEVDGFIVYNPTALDISFAGGGGVSAGTVSSAISELGTNKQVQITATGPLKGLGSGSVSAASGTDITTLIGTNAVTNATNATNAANITIAADTTTNATYYVPYVSATTGNVPAKGTRLTVNPSTGDFTAAGNVTAYSDERLKENWKDISTDILEQLVLVKSGSFDRKDINLRQIGVSAQSLQKIMPEAVVDNDKGLSVAYGNAALVICIELAKKVLELEKRLGDK